MGVVVHDDKRRPTMKRELTILVTLTAMTGAACMKPDGEDGIRGALPEASALQIKLPGGSAKPDAVGGDVGSTSRELLGETAQFYAFTRIVSRDLNRGAAFVLILVHTIVQYPVTTVEGDTYIWGPWTETLNPAEWRLTVTQDEAGDYHWAFEGRRKNDPTAAFVAVVNGVATPGELEGRGVGSFSLDFDKAEELDPVGNDAQGQIDVAYDLESNPAHVTMDYATMATTPEGGTEAVTFHYEYAEAPDGSGDFQFTLHGDLDDNGSAWEDTQIRSRWVAAGAGRSDILITGGDAGTTEVTAAECWDESFGRVYYSDSVEFQPTEGDAADCAFSDALLPGA
jgi:hypothetical protein